MNALLRAMVVGAAAVAAMMTTSADAAHVTRAWHVDRSDPDSTLCKESGATRTVITTGAGSSARYDDPTPTEWRQAGCEASRPRQISHAEVVRRINAQTAEMTRPLDFTRDILPEMRALAARNAAAQARYGSPAQ